MHAPKFNILHRQDMGKNFQYLAHNYISISHITHLGLKKVGTLK